MHRMQEENNTVCCGRGSFNQKHYQENTIYASLVFHRGMVYPGQKVLKEIGVNKFVPIVRAQCVGRYDQKSYRYILCKSQFFKEVLTKWWKHFKGITVHEDFPPEIESHRKILYPIYKAANIYRDRSDSNASCGTQNVKRS